MDGFVGRLTQEQNQKLMEMWKIIIDMGKCNINDPPKVDVSKRRGIKALLGKKRASSNSLVEEKDSDLLFELFLAFATDDPDSLILRFLRARKWDVNKGVEMLLNALKWRAQMDIPQLLAGGERDLGKQIESGKFFVFGKDKMGNLVSYTRVKLHDKNAQSQEDSEKFTVYYTESVRRILPKGHEKITLVFDLTDFTMNSMDYQMVKFLVTCFEAYYPESLHQCLVVNAPWIFWGCWKIIKPWIDPIICEKIKFLKSYSELVEFIDVDQIPKYFGGENPYEFKYDEFRGESQSMPEDKVNETNSKFDTLRDSFVETTLKLINDPNNQNLTLERNKLKEQIQSLNAYIESFYPKSIFQRSNISIK
ncbi:CRAL/TRIO domain-containing protein [Rozella allomycis CSF55]|uniref:CRAL/TRIO domain-containing protein n=1 Tax=Rozella allomycis (strain CSF55) TaxID=988480 RepID=A0A4P9YEV4_ROZAC|nr:CRAL/TRIO domain-containing protein [Rozella allomycis CSF55]